MLAGLAGVVHDRQRADGDEHNRDEDNDEGALHGDLPLRDLRRQVT